MRRPARLPLAFLLCAFLLAPAAAWPATPSADALAKKTEGDRLRDAGDLEGARRSYEQSLEASPGFAAALNELGSLSFATGDLGDAIARFKQAVAADRSYALGFYNLGYASRKTGDFRQASDAYRRYVALRPDDPDGYYGLAESYRALGDKPSAIAAYEQYARRERRESERPYVEKALKLAAELRAAERSAGRPVGDPAKALQKINEGDAWMKQGKHREALVAYQDAVAAEPASPDALFRLGLGYAFLGYFPEAIERWNAVLESPRASPELRQRARSNLDKAKVKLGAAGSAPAAGGGHGAAAAGAGGAAKGHYDRGNQLYGARQYAEAVEAYGKAIEVKPDYAYAYVARANALIGLGQLEKAQADLERARSLSPSAASPLYGLATIFERRGDRARAAELYKQYAASTAPDANASLKAAASQKAQALAR